jgi:hypothetical protein
VTSLRASHFRRPITEAVPEIVDVVDVTDHTAGSNPYFEAAKK